MCPASDPFCPTGLSRLCCLPHEDRSLSASLQHTPTEETTWDPDLSVVHKGFMPGCGVDHDVTACLGATLVIPGFDINAIMPQDRYRTEFEVPRDVYLGGKGLIPTTPKYLIQTSRTTA